MKITACNLKIQFFDNLWVIFFLEPPYCDSFKKLLDKSEEMEFQGRVPLPHQPMMPLRHHSFSIGRGCSWQHYTLGTGGRTKVYELTESLNWVEKWRGSRIEEFRIWFDLVSIPFLNSGSPWFKAFKDRVSLSDLVSTFDSIPFHWLLVADSLDLILREGLITAQPQNQ